MMEFVGYSSGNVNRLGLGLAGGDRERTSASQLWKKSASDRAFTLPGAPCRGIGDLSAGSRHRPLGGSIRWALRIGNRQIAEM